MSGNLTRRGFMKGAAATVAVPYVVSGSVLRAATAPSNRIGLGLIGCGGQGQAHHQYRPPLRVYTAVCDPVKAKREALQQLIGKDCKAYNDFRDLIADPNVDAVDIATPEHWHVIPAVMAAKAGKDAYVEKPLGLTIHEGRVLSDTFRRLGRVFQHGTQWRTLGNYRHMAELILNGRIGKVHTVEVASKASPGGGPIEKPEAVPEGFDYDLWLGQAPWAPYSPGRVGVKGGRPWTWIRDYAGGFVTGYGIHWIDLAQLGLGADNTGPVEVEGQGRCADGLFDMPLKWRVEYRYANGVKLIYSCPGPVGCKFIGTEGWIEMYTGKAEPASVLTSQIGPNEIHLPRGGSFEQCVRTREETLCPPEAAHRSTTVCHLANICMQLGRKLRWDPEKETFPDDPEANRLISRTMRSPWRL